MNPTTPTATPTINSLKTDAYAASGNADKLATDAPTMLAQLKQNLVGVFSNDNPIMAARDKAAQDYLSEANNTRASMLPGAGNLPVINGRQTTLSPTQQQSIVDAHLAAALTPLVGYNNQITGEYGTIQDLLKNAGDIYSASIKGAQDKASNLIDLYKTAVAELQARNSAPVNALNDPTIQALLASIMKGNGSSSQSSLDDIFALPSKPAAQPAAQPASPAIPVSAPLTNTPTPSLWDNIMSLFGATPKDAYIQTPSQSPTLTLPSGGLNFSGLNLPGLGK